VTWFRARFAWLAACSLLAVLVASAHEARPAYLEIKETTSGQFSVLWRTPVLAGMRLPVVLKLPDKVKNVREPNIQELADSFVERRWIDAGPNGLAGKRIEFPGLQLSITDVLVRVELLEDRGYPVRGRHLDRLHERAAHFHRVAPQQQRSGGRHLRPGAEGRRAGAATVDTRRRARKRSAAGAAPADRDAQRRS
jgi:hypothetical protein